MTEIGQSDEIKEMKERRRNNRKRCSGNAHQRRKKRVKALLDQKREALQSVIMPPLLDMAEKHVIHPLMDDSMIMNAAFLVKKEDAARLEGVVAGLDRHFEDRINFRIIGPLPPYSFRTFEVKTVDYEQLDPARKLLQLKRKPLHRKSGISTGS